MTKKALILAAVFATLTPIGVFGLIFIVSLIRGDFGFLSESGVAGALFWLSVFYGALWGMMFADDY